MKRPAKSRHGMSERRRGAALVETAITLPVFLLIVLGMIDLGLLVIRSHLCAEAARIGARMTIVHGADALEMGAWTSESAVNGIRSRIDPLMTAAGIDSSEVTVNVIYQQTEDEEDNNAPGQEVLVQVSIDYHHVGNLSTFLGLPPLITVASESRMAISN